MPTTSSGETVYAEPRVMEAYAQQNSDTFSLSDSFDDPTEWREFLERRQVRLGLALKADHGKDLHLEAKLAGIHLGVIPTDKALLLERAHAAQAGRRGNPHAAGQFHVGHSAIGLQFGEDLAVNLVQTGEGHGLSDSISGKSYTPRT